VVKESRIREFVLTPQTSNNNGYWLLVNGYWLTFEFKITNYSANGAQKQATKIN
jgi:hypothetical protein